MAEGSRGLGLPAPSTPPVWTSSRNFCRSSGSSPSRWEQETYQVAYEDEQSCLIFGCYTVTSDEETGLFIRTLQRVSFFFRLVGGRLKVVHMHLSHPYEFVDSDEVFPFRYGKDAFDYIQRTHQMAFTDSLTELGNRNAYETRLREDGPRF